MPTKPTYLLSHHRGWRLDFFDLASLQAAVVASGIVLSPDVVDGVWCAFDPDGEVILNAVRCKKTSGIGGGRYGCTPFKVIWHAESLGLPIPSTGKKQRWLSNHYRRNRHVGVLRGNIAVALEAKEHDVPIKGVRSKGTPPNPWNDELPSRVGRRNWKGSRRTQWKPLTLAAANG